MFDAMTDLYAILPLGKRGKPLLKKRRDPSDRKPGLVGGALERAVEKFGARLGFGAGRGRRG